MLPIGGLKEKLLAALRGGVRVVVIPHENQKDLVDLPKSVTEGLKIIPVRWIDEVLEIALERPVTPLPPAGQGDVPVRAGDEAGKRADLKH